MKIAIITDTHFGARNGNSNILNNQQLFYSNIFFPTLKKHNIDTVLHGGDLFDNRKFINYNVLSFTKNVFLDVLENNNIKMYVVVGNHDTFFKNTNKINSLSLLLKGYDNIEIITNDIRDLVFDGMKITMVPWLTDDNTDKILSKLKTTSSHLVIGHFEIIGFPMNGGMTCSHGLDKETFFRFDKVISGHFHSPSIKANIEYIGAPYEMDWSDHNSKRGFYILDTETKKYEFIENTYALHHVIEYDDTTEDFDVKGVSEMDLSALKNTFVKVITKNVKHPAMLSEFINKIQEYNDTDVKVIEKDQIHSIIEENMILEDEEGVDSTKKIMENVVDSLSLEKTKKDILKEFMTSVYIKCLQEKE